MRSRRNGFYFNFMFYAEINYFFSTLSRKLLHGNYYFINFKTAYNFREVLLEVIYFHTFKEFSSFRKIIIEKTYNTALAVFIMINCTLGNQAGFSGPENKNILFLNFGVLNFRINNFYKKP